ncbi:MAG: hypothetical protein LUQ04_04325 [Methanoregula sp.]|nr:hypothetical protein [Methanoregula sp.]
MKFPECTGSLVPGKRVPVRIDYFLKSASVRNEKGTSCTPLEMTRTISGPREGNHQRYGINNGHEPWSGGFLRGTFS